MDLAITYYESDMTVECNYDKSPHLTGFPQAELSHGDSYINVFHGYTTTDCMYNPSLA